MTELLAAFLSSFIVTSVIIYLERFHLSISADSDFSSPQRFHFTPIPRIGSIGIFAGVCSTTFFVSTNNLEFNTAITLIACAFPIFVIGLTEDLTKNISVRTRLIATTIAAALPVYFLPLQIIKIDIPYIDFAFTTPILSAAFTIFAITGLTHAYNIIDGFNGQASMTGIITLIAIAYLSHILSDSLLMYLSLAMMASILGFFIWNYPKGLIFLGDGGAYLIGFWIASLSIMLTYRHQEISPWFAFLCNIYPITETIFTIYRRKVYQGKNTGRSDGMHLHTLIYRRALKSKKYNQTSSLNSKTAPYIWLLTSLGVVPAALFWESTLALITFSSLFVILYIWLYSKIVRLKIPRWIFKS